MLESQTRKLTIIAQDPGVKDHGNRILRAQVDVPMEMLEPGPWGHRVQVIDYDASNDLLYKPLSYTTDKKGRPYDPYANASDDVLLKDPRFHAQNVYAIVMRILARFEFALGRRVAWSFKGHQLKVAPHAFAEANAFYSPEDQALQFGFFPSKNGDYVYTCLSHDVVAHETCHAILDGLRERYMDPSSPDQAAFHEGFSDIVAMLSIFALKNVATFALTKMEDDNANKPPAGLIRADSLTPEKMRTSILMSIAEQMGEETSCIRGEPLRQSAKLKPDPKHLKSKEFIEPHRRGEILVAAMMNAFLTVWTQRLVPLGRIKNDFLDLDRVAEEGSRAADYLLTMAIRAIDYSTPVHMEFSDYLSALLTADYEIRPNETGFPFRKSLLESFKAYGIFPSSKGDENEPGIWKSLSLETEHKQFNRSRTHFESLIRDPEEVFRFIWENRGLLGLLEGAYTRVLSVRPCLRIGQDGFALRETVAEYVQMIDLLAAELPSLKIQPPKDMPPDMTVRLYGGGVLILDEYGSVKFHIHNRLNRPHRQSERLEYLWENGFFEPGASMQRRFSHIHLMRAINSASSTREAW